MPKLKGNLSAGLEEKKDEKAGGVPPAGKPAEGEGKPGDKPAADGESSEEEGDEPPDDEAPPNTKPDPEEEEASEDDEKKKSESSASKSSLSQTGLRKFCTAFGNEKGAEYFLAEISFEEAQGRHIKSLTADKKALEGKLAAFANAGVDPVDFTAQPDKRRDKSNGKPGAAKDGSELSARDQVASALADAAAKE